MLEIFPTKFYSSIFVLLVKNIQEIGCIISGAPSRRRRLDVLKDTEKLVFSFAFMAALKDVLSSLSQYFLAAIHISRIRT